MNGNPFRGRLADWVYNQIARDIETATLAPGAAISERELIGSFQISRTPIREALQRLASEGYLRQLHRGYQVVELTEQQIINAYAVRGMLEGMAARQIAGTRRHVDLARLQEALEKEQDALAGAGTPSQVSGVIENFHAVLAEACANDFLESVLKVARWRTEPYTRRRANIPGTAALDIEEHRRLVQAIADGDSLLAELIARMLTRRAIRELTGRELSGDGQMAELMAFVIGRAYHRPPEIGA